MFRPSSRAASPIAFPGYSTSTSSLRPSGSYDIAGVWRPDGGFKYDDVSTRGYQYGAYGSNYDVGSYGGMGGRNSPYRALEEYEEHLRLMRDISEEERMRRWEDRMRFEELEEEERLRRWERMEEEDRLRLGLRDYRSQHNHRYNDRRSRRHSQGVYSPTSSSYGWDSNRLPLSSSLSSRFGRSGAAGYSHNHGTNSRYPGEYLTPSIGDSVQYSINRDRASLAGLSETERRRVALDMDDNRRARTPGLGGLGGGIGGGIGGGMRRPGILRRRSKSVPRFFGGSSSRIH